MDSYIKPLNDGFVSYKHSFSLHKITLIDGLVRIIVICLSAVLTAPIHCRGSIIEQVMNATFLQICSKETNLFTSWMACRQIHFQQIFIFGWTVPLKSAKTTTTKNIFITIQNGGVPCWYVIWSKYIHYFCVTASIYLIYLCHIKWTVYK